VELEAVERQRKGLMRFLAFADHRLRDAGLLHEPTPDEVVLEAVVSHPGIRMSLIPAATGQPSSVVRSAIEQLASRAMIRRQGLGWVASGTPNSRVLSECRSAA
jgi:hypothetical protein